MSIDREDLTKNQQTIYDVWVDIRKGDPDDPELEKLLILAGMPKSRIRAVSAERQETLRREAELVFKHLYNQKKPITTTCKNCGELFVTDYEYAKHCSDECLRRSLEKLGLTWHPEKTPQERWHAVQPPCIIEPESVKAIWKEEELDFSLFAPEEREVTAGGEIIIRSAAYGSARITEEQLNGSMRDVTAEIVNETQRMEDHAVNCKIFGD